MPSETDDVLDESMASTESEEAPKGSVEKEYQESEEEVEDVPDDPDGGPESTPPNGPEGPSFSGSLSEWGNNDLATDEDDLGFDTYVQVLKEFLVHDETTPPLTISIEGEWGAGKSSFMEQLRKALKKEEGQTVWFNPWRHDGQEALWAAFMLEFLQQIRADLSLSERWQGRKYVTLKRIKWKRVMFKSLLFLPFVVILLIPFLVTNRGIVPEPLKFLVWDEISTDLAASGQFLSLIVFGVGTMVWIRRNITNPIERELQAVIDNPDYQNQVPFIEEFHNDFENMLDAYVGNEQVFVFIDDLDRCTAPKAAELMQSIHLMIANDSRMFFIVGMDRAKVAAGIAAKHDNLLPYIYAAEYDHVDEAVEKALTQDDSSSGSTGARSLETFGLRYGDSYMEKFVQIPFQVPKPSNEEIGELITSIMQEDEDDTSENGGTDTSEDEEDKTTSSDESQEEPDELDSDQIKRIGMLVAPAFDYNPRLVKTFVNLFRLRTMLATELKLFGASEGSEDRARLTPEQLGKFVAISIRWPALLPHLDQKTLEILHDAALEFEDRDDTEQTEQVLKGVDIPSPVDSWSTQNQKQLLDLLAVVEDDDGRNPHDYYLTNVDVKELLQISPRIDRPAQSSDSTTSAAG